MNPPGAAPEVGDWAAPIDPVGAVPIDPVGAVPIGPINAVPIDRDDGPAPVLRRVDHVGIAVADLDAAIAFYRDTFGLLSVHEELNEEQGVREAMLAVGDGQTRVQLLAPISPDSPIARFLDRSGPGVQQVAYTVDDVEQATDRLRAKGLRILFDSARRGTAGSRVNFVHPRDAGGVLVELVQPAEP